MSGVVHAGHRDPQREDVFEIGRAESWAVTAGDTRQELCVQPALVCCPHGSHHLLAAASPSQALNGSFVLQDHKVIQLALAP